jgi:hypothetical protein
LEQENTVLITQIEEITMQQINRDKMLDEFGIAIDARIFEWKVCSINIIIHISKNKKIYLYNFKLFVL